MTNLITDPIQIQYVQQNLVLSPRNILSEPLSAKADRFSKHWKLIIFAEAKGSS